VLLTVYLITKLFAYLYEYGHIIEITSKAHQRASCILRSFTSGDESLLIRAFMVYARPIVEYNILIASAGQLILNMTLIQSIKCRGDSLNASVVYNTCRMMNGLLNLESYIRTSSSASPSDSLL